MNPKFTPSPSDIRVNILWFLSLIFSLATVLIGIIALQWLREHLRAHTNLEPQIAISLHHLNVDSFNRWYLPQIFTALPLLLQIALVLFLIGILEFLWNLNHTVAIPIAVAVGFCLFFLLLTTILPTMQALSLFLPRCKMGSQPRSPCPYRSPQSWAFHQLVRPLVTIILRLTRPVSSRSDCEELMSHNMVSENARPLLFGESGPTRRNRPTNLIFRHKPGDSWVELEIAWLFQRDLDHMAGLPVFIESGLNNRYRPVPIYDTFKTLVHGLANGSSHDALLAHYCDELLVQANQTDMDYMRCLTYLVADVSRSGSDWRAERVSLEALKNHNTLFFHLVRRSRQPDGVKEHIFELIMSTTRAMFANGPKPLDGLWLAGPCPYNYYRYDGHPGEHS